MSDKRLLDKEWRMSHLYKIKNKDAQLVTFNKNPVQIDFDKNKHTRNIILKSRQLGFCVGPETLVLTADLRWQKIKTLVCGQEIIGVDEFPPGGRGKGRKMKTGIVEKVVEVEREAYKISFDDGREVICTGQHPWLSKKTMTDCKWRTIEWTKKWRGILKVGTYVRWIAKPWSDIQSYEDGWYGGMLDGEGSMRLATSIGGKSSEVSCCQRKGDVWDRMLKYVDDNDYHYGIDKDDTPRKSKFGIQPIPKIRIVRMDEVFRLLGTTRPSRFVDNRFWENRELPGKKTSIGWAKIVKIKKIGKRKMIDLQTSCKTYIAEGFVSHNTTFEGVDMFDDVLFTRNLDTIFIAQDLDTAIDIFSNKINLLWDNYKLKQYYNVTTEQARKIKLGFGDGTFSSILVDNSGRSGTYRRVHITEFAMVCKKFPARAKEIIEGTIPAIPTDGRVDIESTAEDEYGLFHDMFWEAWNRGEPTNPVEFKAHFYNWTWDFEEMRKIKTPETDLPVEFKEYQEKMNLTDLEITYYYYKWLALNKNWRSLRKEYPTTPEEAFASAGDKVFDTDKLAEMVKLDGEKHGDWIYYKDYKPGHRYGMGADVAEGIGRDSSTACIWDYTTGNGIKPQVVAEYCSNKIPPDTFAYELRNGGNKYGTCMVAVERNNHGHATLSKLKEIYPTQSIYTEKVFNKMLDTETEKLGWHTNLATKPDMLYELNTAINEELVDIHSKYIIQELKTYPKEDLRVMRAKDETSTHWDRLMACGIGWKIRNSFNDEYGACLTNDIQSDTKHGVTIVDGFVTEEDMLFSKEEKDHRYL